MPNPVAVDFVKSHEGLSLTSYQDSGGVWTIGYGATGPDIGAHLTWTQVQADARLTGDLNKSEAQVLKLLQLTLSQSQMAALISFVFNLGSGALASSHMLLLVNARDWINAAKELPKWDHVGQAEVKGLLIRRLEEAVLFLKGS